LHRHKEALEQAMESAKVGNLIVQDLVALCFYYSKRIDFEAMNSNEKGLNPNNSTRNNA